MILGVENEGMPNLPEIGLAFGRLCRGAYTAENRDEDRCEDSNNGDDGKKLDERESADGATAERQPHEVISESTANDFSRRAWNGA